MTGNEDRQLRACFVRLALRKKIPQLVFQLVEHRERSQSKMKGGHLHLAAVS